MAAMCEPFLSDFAANCDGVCPEEFLMEASAPATRRQRMISASFSFTAACSGKLEPKRLFFFAETSVKPFFLSQALALAVSAACFSSSRSWRSALAASSARRCCSSRSWRSRSSAAAASCARRFSSATRRASASSAARLFSSASLASLSRAAAASASACRRAFSSCAACSFAAISSSSRTTGMFTLTVSLVGSEDEQALHQAIVSRGEGGC
mmetsp:Transcript_71219/g.183609  ORF Transcript_71219/g.183609 Transcript_71219/m.183609 type:complete len:211 (-) Transcript_71219:66-698(-)